MTTGSDDLDTTKASVRRLSLDIQKAIIEEEDIIRNAIYKKLEAEISNDGDDCDEGPPPEISEFLNLTSDPLCIKLAQTYATCGDEMVALSYRLCQIGDQLTVENFISLHFVNFTDFYNNIALRLFEDGITLRRLVVFLYLFSELAMRYLGMNSLLISMNMLLQYAEGFIRRIEINRKSNTRKRNRRNNSQRPSSKYVYIAVPIITMAGTAFYFFWK